METARPLAVVVVAVILFAGSLGLLGRLGSELIPELIQGEFFADIELPPGARLEVTDRRLTELTKVAAGISRRLSFTSMKPSSAATGSIGPSCVMYAFCSPERRRDFRQTVVCGHSSSNASQSWRTQQACRASSSGVLGRIYHG